MIKHNEIIILWLIEITLSIEAVLSKIKYDATILTSTAHVIEQLGTVSRRYLFHRFQLNNDAIVIEIGKVRFI